METINTYYEDYLSLEKFVSNNGEVLLASSNRAVLVQVFSGICDKNYLVAISRQIRELIPGAEVIGTTTSGEIMNGLVSGLKTVLSFSVFRHSDIKLVFAEKDIGDDYELGRSIANTLNSDKAKVLILFATGLRVNASQLLKGVQSVNDALPVAGGNAGDNRSKNTQRFVCCNENVTDCGVVGVILESDHLKVAGHSHLGWQPLGKEMTITRAEGSRVYTIDYIPAYQVYRQYLGVNTNSNIFNVMEFPLTICKHGIIIARAPFLRYEDDSIGFHGDIAEGEKVRFSFGDVEMILEKVDILLQTIQQQPVESIFVYSCASRRGFLQESAQIETLPLQDIAPTAGFFTSGEFFHADNSNQLLNTTMTTLVLSESNGSQKVFAPEPERIVCSDSNVAVIKDNVADRSLVILKSLAHLVNTVTSELNERTAELEAANKALYLSEERFSKAFLCNPDPISITTMNAERYVEVNDAWLEYTAYQRDEVIGHTSSELSSWAIPEERDQIIIQIQEHGKIRNLETKFKIKSGEIRTVLLSAEIIDMENEPHLLFVSKDITEWRMAEKRSLELMMELKSANLELKDFAYIVSHDLKAPLRGIRSLADWLYNDYQDKFDEEGKEQLDMLINRVDRMNKLIEGILRYSRLTSKNEEKTVININQVVEEAIEMLQPPNNISIIIENEMPWLTLERTRTQQLFTNLINNAMKYMDKPNGEIRISCQKQGEFWQFSIQDNGCGIEEKNFDNIFTVFKTLKSRDEYESTGIGLTIVKKIVEIYGGTVWVESKFGKGSTFYFTVPSRN